jgi:hypothetical protein
MLFYRTIKKGCPLRFSVAMKLRIATVGRQIIPRDSVQASAKSRAIPRFTCLSLGQFVPTGAGTSECRLRYSAELLT